MTSTHTSKLFLFVYAFFHSPSHKMVWYWTQTLSLQVNPALKHLRLAHNNFEEIGARCFKEALCENESLELLDLNWNHFSSRGAAMLAEGLEVLCVLYCCLHLSPLLDVYVLTWMVITKLKTVYFRTSLRVVFAVFSNHTTQFIRCSEWTMKVVIRVIVCVCSDDDWVMMIDDWWWCHKVSDAGWQENVGLKCFSMAMAGLGFQGGQHVGEVFRHNRTLLELDVSYCRISADGIPHLAAGLRENDILQVLKVSFIQNCFTLCFLPRQPNALAWHIPFYDYP